MALCVVAVVLLTSCATEERREIRLTPTSTVETGVRILVDNCPGPTTVQLAVREDVLWQIESGTVPETTDAGDDSATSQDTTVDDTLPDDTLSDDTAAAEEAPGIAEFLVGQEPEGWTTSTPLESPLSAGVRYTIRTAPDGQSIDFSTPDLAAGLLWDGQGNAQFNPNLINDECSEAADVGAFAESLVVLLLLGVTAAALVIVAIILILFVITRRFSRVRSIQKQASREPGAEQGSAKGQRPRVRSKS